jgi:hypothetical protein
VTAKGRWRSILVSVRKSAAVVGRRSLASTHWGGGGAPIPAVRQFTPRTAGVRPESRRSRMRSAIDTVSSMLHHRPAAVLRCARYSPGCGCMRTALHCLASDIPIVFIIGSDPVKERLVASLARPAGNLTGVTTISSELNPKRLSFCRTWYQKLKSSPYSSAERPESSKTFGRRLAQRRLQLVVAEAQTKP